MQMQGYTYKNNEEKFNLNTKIKNPTLNSL